MEGLSQFKIILLPKIFWPTVGNGRQYLLGQQAQLVAVYVYEVYRTIISIVGAFVC